MSQPLIPLLPSTIGGTKINSVNARDLHTFLGVGTRFNDWIVRRIQEFDFVEHRDFEVYSELSNVSNQQLTTSKDYALTLDMAKELAMVERNEKGRQARAYFIECERKANDPAYLLMTMTRPEMLELALGLAKEKEALRTKVVEMTPKAEFHDKVTDCQDGQSILEIAKVLGTGQNRMFRWLKDQGILMANNLPYQDYLDRGYFRVIEQTPWIDGNGNSHVPTKTLITGKGSIWLAKQYAKQGGSQEADDADLYANI